MKKFAGNIIILHMCTKNHSHMMYSSWDIECNRQNVLSLWTIYALLLPYGPINSKCWKNKKNTWRYHFTNVYHNGYHIWFFRYGVQRTKFFFILDHFLPFYLKNNPKNQYFEKLQNAPGYIIILYNFPKNYDHMLYYSLDMARNRFNCYFSFWAIFYPFISLAAQ